MKPVDSDRPDPSGRDREETILSSTIEIIAKYPNGSNDSVTDLDPITLACQGDHIRISPEDIPQGRSALIVGNDGKPLFELALIPENATIVINVDGKRILELNSENFHWRTKHIVSHWKKLVAESVLLGISMADSLVDLISGDEAAAVDRLEKCMNKALERSKRRLGLTNAYKIAVRNSNLLLHYERLYEICKPFKKYHDHSYMQYCQSNRNHSREEWRLRWRQIVTDINPNQVDLLDYFSLPENLSAAQVARTHLAAQWKCSVTYLEKLLTRARKETTKGPGWNAFIHGQQNDSTSLSTDNK